MTESAESTTAAARASAEDDEQGAPSGGEPSGPEIRPGGDFLREVEEATGQSLSACFQCRKCTCGCPLNEEMDVQPNQIVRLVQFGRRDDVLRSKSIWLCASCETCAARCPNEVDIAAVMDYLRSLALREGVEPADDRVAKFHQSFLDTIRKYGRSHEADMIRRYKLRTGTLFDHMHMGIEMFKKGKIKVIGRKIDDLQAFRELMDRYRSGNG
jgi:heterodisulfide reductase subunit C